MKKAWIIALCLIPTIAMTQSTEIVSIDKRLYDVFEKNYLERLQVNNSFLIQYYNFYLDHSYKIIDVPEGKGSRDFKEVKIKQLKNLKKVNILKIQQNQGLVRDQNSYLYYRIKKTNKLLVLLPEKEFAKMLNQHLGRTY